MAASGRLPAVRARLHGRRPAETDVRVLGFASIAMTLAMYGQTPGVAVFIDPVMGDLGLDRGAVSTAYAVGSLASAVLLPWVGRQLDIRGVRTGTLLIAAAFGVSLALLAGAQGVVWLAVGFAGIRLLGQGALGLAGRNAVTLHFRVGLGRAVAISGSVAALVSSVVPFLLAAVISSLGWREAWLGAAISVWAIVLPATLLLLPRSGAADAHSDVVARVAGGRSVAIAAVGPDEGPWTRGRALRTPMFWLITLANAAGAVILTGFAFHQISVLGEAGLSPEAAAAMFVPLTIASVGFLAIVAPLAGRWSSRAILAASMMPLVGAMLLVPLLGTVAVPVVYACALGAALGAGQVLDGILYPRHFGIHAIGAIRGVAFTVVATASAAGPIIVDVLHGLTGSYVAAAAVLALPPVVLIGAAYLVPRPATRA